MDKKNFLEIQIVLEPSPIQVYNSILYLLRCNYNNSTDTHDFINSHHACLFFVSIIFHHVNTWYGITVIYTQWTTADSKVLDIMEHVPAFINIPLSPQSH